MVTSCLGSVRNIALSCGFLNSLGHDSSLAIADPTSNAVQLLNTKFLPFSDNLWVTPNSIVAVGHDCEPLLFSANNKGVWQFVERLDQAPKKAAGAGSSAFNKFRQVCD